MCIDEKTREDRTIYKGLIKINNENEVLKWPDSMASRFNIYSDLVISRNELGISTIQLLISPIHLVISPIHLVISPIQLMISTIQLLIRIVDIIN